MAVKLRNVQRKQGYITLELEGDMHVLITYISPNIQIPEFKSRLQVIMREVEVGTGEWLLAGDFNSKAAEWGSPVTEERGREVSEWAAALDLTIFNDGKEPTCITANGQSYVDLTLGTPGCASKVGRWRVEEDITLSDHQHIHFELASDMNRVRGRAQTRGRLIPSTDQEGTRRELKESLEELRGRGDITLEEVTSRIKRAQKAHTYRSGGEQARVPYWWSAEIGVLRGECIRVRRLWLRACRLGRDSPQATRARAIFSEKKKALTRAIRGAKRDAWKRLCSELENDVWGLGYRIATKHLRGLLPTHDIPDEEKIRIVRKLFPKGKGHRYVQCQTDDIPPITVEELKRAADNLRSGTAPGMDGITVQTIKNCVEDCPSVIKDLLNDMMVQQTFPDTWKDAKVVLIPKSTEGSEKKFRPILPTESSGKAIRGHYQGSFDDLP